MVIDFLMFTSRPLWCNDHWFVCHIETLCEAMVIDSFTSRPSMRQWSLISLSYRGPLGGNGHRFLYMKTLCETMVIDFFVTSRPPTRQWSSIPLHKDPLRDNGHWFLCHIEALSETMVIDLFPFDIDPLLGIGLIYFFKKSEKKIIKQIDLSDRDPLRGNGHRIF